MNLPIEHMEIYYVGNEAANSKKFKTLRKQNLKLMAYAVQTRRCRYYRRHARRKKFACL